MYFLTAQHVVQLNRQFMAEANEHFAILFYGVLQGCVERIQTILFGEELFPDIYEKAAGLMYCLITRTPFENGNKRTGVAAALTFLEMNGIVVEVDVDESIEFTSRIADSQVNMSEVANWLKSNTREISYRV